MGDPGEAIGTAIEGGMFARAVSGASAAPTGDAAASIRGHFSESACLNCGAALIGPHCHQCGQQAHLHRTIGAFLHDLAHGALHFDGKTWRTLPKLALKPGELTRRYIDGERARFVSPMALFLFSVFLMFAVFQAIGLTPPTELPPGDAMGERLGEVREQLVTEREQLQRRSELGAAERAEARRKLVELEEELAAIDQTRLAIDDRGTLTSASIGKTGWAWLDKGVEKWRTNPGLMLYKLQANSYKFSWLLIPLSVPFVWLLFAWKPRFKAYDHAIFVTYSLAFMSLLFVALSALSVVASPGAVVALAGLLLPPLHIYKQLRGTYALSRFSALWRLSVLLVFIAVVVTLFLQILLLLGTF